MSTATLRASVTADALLANVGDPVPLLVDGADSAIMANGLKGYNPLPGDRVLVQKVGGTLEVVQFLNIGSIPFITTYRQDTAPSTTTAPVGAIWYDTSLTGQGRPNRLEVVSGVNTWVTVLLGSGGLDVTDVRKNVVEKGFTLGGSGGGAALLANGAGTPQIAPFVNFYFPFFHSGLYASGADISNTTAALETYHADSTKWVRNAVLFGTDIQVLNKSDGLVSSIPTSGKAWTSQFYAWYGLARVGSSYIMLGQDNDRSNDVYFYNIDGTTWGKTSEMRLGGVNVFNGFRPALVSNGTQVGMIWSRATNVLTLRWYNPTTWVQVGSDITLDTGVTQQHVGDAVWGDSGSGGGASTLFVSMQANLLVKAWIGVTTTAATRASGFDFARAGYGITQSKVLGMSFDSTANRMVHCNHLGDMFTYSQLAAAGGSQAFLARYTWYDSDTGTYAGAPGSGTVFVNGVDVSGTASTAHETTFSPSQSITLPRRAWVRVTLPTLPPDTGDLDGTHVDRANKAGVYVSLGGGTTWRQAYTTVGQSVVDSFDTMPGSGTPDVHDFTTAFATLGTIGAVATDVGFDGYTNKIMLRGDGTFRLGNYGFVRHFGTRTQSVAVAVTGGAGRTTIAWDTNLTGMVPTGLSYASGFVIAKPGVYMVTASILWAIAQTTGTRGIQINKNGTLVFQNNFDMADLDAANPVQLLTAQIPCVVGDVLTLTASSSITTTVALVDATRTWFQVGFSAQ